MKKFRKRLVSVALSTGIALGGIATCNLCTKTSCSAITSEKIAQLVKEDVGVAQLIEEIRKQDFYKDFVKGKSKSLLIFELQLQRDKLSKAISNAQKAVADFDKALADAEKAEADMDKAIADVDKSMSNMQKAIADAKKKAVDFDKAEADAYKAIAVFCNAKADAYKAKADAYKAKADAYKAIAVFYNAKADTYKAEADADKAIDNMNKVIVQCQKSSFCRNTITPLVSFIENYNISEQHKDKFLNHLVGQLDFMIYLLETDPDLN